jgi:deazaflavin-dependent oxidoreductase (nitroreductase family)
MMIVQEHFLKPTSLERLMNKTVGLLARWGLGPSYLYLLEVRGRTTGRIYATPVNFLEIGGRSYLVGGRGHTAWSKNAKATGVVTLRRGRASCQYRAIPLPDDKKPAILKAYLEAYPGTVQKFFAVRAGQPVDAFKVIADRHPVFELIP